MRHLGPFLVTLALLTPAPAQETRQFDLRSGPDSLKPFRPVGTDAASMLHPEADGLRVSLPEGRAEHRPVGVDLPCTLRGDFEVVLGFELLAIGEPISPTGCGVRLRLTFATPAPRVAMMTRVRKAMDARIVETAGAFCIDGDDREPKNWRGGFRPATGQKGRFRVTRTGTQMEFAAADGDRDFARVWAGPVGDETISAVGLTAQSGDRPTPVSVRFADLSVRAADFAVHTLPAPAAAPPAAVADADAPVAPRRFGLSLVIGFVLACVGVTALLFFLISRRRRGEAGRVSPERR